MAIRIRVYPQPNSVGARRVRAQRSAKVQQQRKLNQLRLGYERALWQQRMQNMQLATALRYGGGAGAYLGASPYGGTAGGMFGSTSVPWNMPASGRYAAPGTTWFGNAAMAGADGWFGASVGQVPPPLAMPAFGTPYGSPHGIPYAAAAYRTGGWLG